MADTIRGLWIGAALGPIERLSMGSFLRHGHGYELYCYEDVAGIPAGVIVKDGREILPETAIFRYQRGPGRGSVSAFSNQFRYKLLLERGGWWMDTDTVCLKPFDFPGPVVIASEHSWWGSKVSSGILRLPPEHDIARQCYEFASRADRAALNWGDIGPKLLQRVVEATGQSHLVEEPRVFCPIPWRRWRLSLRDDPRACSRYLSDDTHAVHLWHEMGRRAGMERLATFPDGSLVSRLMRQYGVDPAGPA